MAADRIMFCRVLLLWIGYQGLIEMRGLLAHLEALVNSKIINPSLVRFFLYSMLLLAVEFLQLWSELCCYFWSLLYLLCMPLKEDPFFMWNLDS
jgi:hypothetical protein